MHQPTVDDTNFVISFIPNQFSKTKKDLKVWQEQLLDDSSCELKITTNEDTYDFIGTKTATIFNDKYAVYFDGLDYIMFNLESKKQIWSVSL